MLRVKHIPGRLNVIADKLSRHNQVIQTEWSPISAGHFVLQMGPTSSKFVCDPVQSQTAKVCFPGAGLDSPGSRCLESAVGSIGGVRYCPRLSHPPGDLKVEGSGLLQNDPHCPRVAKHTLVLGPSEPVSSDSLQASSDTRPGYSTHQRVTAQESQQPQSSCMAPRIVDTGTPVL